MEYNLFFQSINNALNEKELISIFTDKENTDNFSAGFVIILNEETLIFNSINPDGMDDGLEVININDIYEIAYDDQYLKRLKFLRENSDEFIKKTEFILSDNEKSFYDVLCKCKENKVLVSINLCYGIGHYGIINEIDGECVLLQDFDEIGKEDGFSCFKISDIIKIFIDDKKLKKIKMLSKFG